MSDDVDQMMDASSACFHPKRGRRSRSLRQPERRLESQTAAVQRDSSVLFLLDPPTNLSFMHVHTKQKSRQQFYLRRFIETQFLFISSRRIRTETVVHRD
ncbi:unnamed protein product [Protopolystoma xenopodis]|uniref:Uncharacterized protein n=1 Tax=Protopolystoma xenopodis TaxID=117903 RepID=A0A3S5FCV3_9PLAT|nr:unnamed protein product [Protopolystoma xenopodis]